ncbi:helix-turn-helix domain-containing protein [Streptomyces sp. NPDC005840]|uniref:helix-turn-helix domain-containing protein n=1 Tax=Streptomyces sp. NPDC005840 TaxID=3157072 RepID=UPI003410E316
MPHSIGRRIEYHRRLAQPPMTQRQLADAAGLSLGAIRKIATGARRPTGATIEAVADALRVDVSRLLTAPEAPRTRVHAVQPELSAALADYDAPEDGPVRALHVLRRTVAETEQWRLAAQYTRIARTLPALLPELLRSHHAAAAGERKERAALLVRAARSADAMVYKAGGRNLSARLIDVMRWAVPAADDPALEAAVAYVRTETFFAARAHAAGLRALEAAIDAAAGGADARRVAARGALHMRAAVIAGRAGRADAAVGHLGEARALADTLAEGVYCGTAFGPDSVRVHEVSVAVGLGNAHAERALSVARGWKPPTSLPAERRSGFYIEMARAQLWTGRRDAAFEALRAARRIAPQHTREHPWVRHDVAVLRRLTRARADELSAFAQWCAAD